MKLTELKALNDSEILKELSNGNHHAFEYIFRKYYSDLARFSARFVRDQEIAEEITQEVFVSFWENRTKIIITTSIQSYLMTSVKNRSFNHLNSKFSKNHSLHDDGEGDSVPNHADSTDDLLILSELQNAIKYALSSLPEKCGIIFNLSRNEGLLYKEIAEKLDISPKTVENQMGIALKKIREFLEKQKLLLLTLISVLLFF